MIRNLSENAFPQEIQNVNSSKIVLYNVHRHYANRQHTLIMQQKSLLIDIKPIEIYPPTPLKKIGGIRIAKFVKNCTF